ncbi:MAG: TIGR04063 family PEP-CTERM/XrtA system glycosyltransferase [Motiliproteus sp.]
MKILHVFDHSIPLHSGYTFRSRAILETQRALGLETCHVTSPKHGPHTTSQEQIEGLDFYRSEAVSNWSKSLPIINQLAYIPPLSRRISQVIEQEKPDIIQAHSPSLNGVAALQAAKQAGLPVVYEVRAFWEDAAVNHGTSRENGLRYRLTRAMESYVLRQADAVTCICQGLKSDIIARGVMEERVTTIPNAVDILQFNPSSIKDPKLQALHNLDNRFVLGFIGSFYEYEGLDLLVDAFKQLQDQLPLSILMLVGGGFEEQRLKEQVSRLGMTERVIFTGRVPHHEINRYYSLIDLLVYPRKSMRLTELVTPLKPLEAMAQKSLFLASDVGGHRELITDNETGYLYPADNTEALAAKILQINTSRDQWARICDNGRTFVEQERNWHRSVANYLPIYQKLVAAGAKR